MNSTTETIKLIQQIQTNKQMLTTFSLTAIFDVFEFKVGNVFISVMELFLCSS